ncbi:MAG TPA: ATP-binding protein [Burkholderiales bacterium]|nr:ATP-binding protein [Burkholderiales bacterium]
MTVPVVVDDEVKYVLAATIGSAYWSRWLAERVPQGISASITGKDNNVLARSEDAQRTLGKPVTGWYLELIQAQQHGFARGPGILAPDLVAAWQRSRVSGWTVNVFTSATAVDRPMRRTMVLLGAGLLATLAVVAGLTLTRGRVLTRGVEQLRLALESLKGPDPAIPPPTTPVAEFNAALVAAAETAKVLESRGQALRDADRRKDEFLATLAHELRGPMAPIRNAVELLRLRPGADEIADTARDIIERQVEHMRRLVDDLLDVARITRGAIQLLRQPVDVALIVQEALEATRPLMDKAGIQLHVTVPNERLQLDADRTRVVQVISNLLANSAKFTRRGGNAWVTVRREQTWASIEVRDDGAGIETSHLTHIFDMFSRPGAGSERAAEGLGIGLALVRGLVEQHGGTVSAASEGRDKGATFTVRLPLLADSDLRHPQADASPAAVSGSRRILVADDLRDAAVTLAQVLRLKGHEVLVAHDGVEAFEIASREKPQVALLDLGMPRMSGYELAARIRAEAWGRDMLLVAVSGWGQQHDRERAAKAGFDVHLTKPADPAQLDNILAGLASR